MSITNLLRKATALTLGALLMLSYVPLVSAAHVPIHMSGAAATVLSQNGGSVVQTFSPDLGLDSSTSATLEANASSTTDAYYGIEAVSATTSTDVHWEITISHATEALTSGDVDVVEVGTFDVDSGAVRGTPATYTTAESSGDLVLTGDIMGWSIANGEDMTNVDKITFATDAPLGTYTFTRVLVDETSGTDFPEPFSFTVNLEAASGTTTPDTTAPNAPVVTFPTSPYSTSTNPINIYGTAEANSSIMITGGASTSTATTTGAGNWNASVTLTASSTNNLLITASDASGNTSSSTLLVVTATSTSGGGGAGTSTGATSTPIITLLGDATTTVFACNGFVEPGFSAVDSTGATITATSSGSINLSLTGTPQYITYTATDSEGNTASTTRAVIVRACSTGSGRGSRGISRAAEVTPPASTIPGQAIGLTALQTYLVPPGQVGQVLGASTMQFTSTLRMGSRGAEVTALQQRLTETGYYSGPITGYYGQLTRAAVQRFQRANGLPPAGQVGPMTRALLNS